MCGLTIRTVPRGVVRHDGMDRWICEVEINLKRGNLMKQTSIILISLAAGLLFTACPHQDLQEGETGEGHIELLVIFNNYEPQETTAMIMAYLWEGATWAEAEDAGPIDPTGQMFMVSTVETITGESGVTFSDLPEGTYWCGVFETVGMNYDTRVDTVGYYNAGVDTTFNSMLEPSALVIDKANEDVDVSMETLVLFIDCAGVENGSSTLDLCGTCDDDSDNDCVPLVSGDVNLEVEFINWEPDPNAIMYMAYVWVGGSWSEALAAGEIQNQMFGVFPGGGTANGTFDVTFTNLSEGTYFSGVFETIGMTHDTAIKLVGYYNSFEDPTHNSQDEPSALQTGENSLAMQAAGP